MWLAKLLLFAAVAYLLVVAAVFFAQTALLFPTRMVASAGPIPPGARPLVARAASGEQLHGLHIAPRKPQQGEKLLVLGFGGNAWNAQSVAVFLHDLFPEADVAAFHYRGYAPSEGRAGAAALLADAPLVLDAAVAATGADRVVAVGFSIGSGVAAHLASRRPIAGAILVTPFDSLQKLAASHYRWLPTALLLRHRMEPLADLRKSQVPVALIVAERDTLVPPERARALARGLPRLALDQTISGVGHNDIYQHPAFAPAMREALQRVGSSSPSQLAP